MAGKGRPGPECGIGRLLRESDLQRRAELLELLGDDTVKHTVLTRLLAKLETPIGYSVIRWHRIGMCRCHTA